MTNTMVKLNELTSKDINSLMENSKVREKVDIALGEQVKFQLDDFVDKLQGLGNYSISDSSDYNNCLLIENSYLFLASLKDACEYNSGILSTEQLSKANMLVDDYLNCDESKSYQVENEMDSMAEKYANILLESMVSDYDVIYNEEEVKYFMSTELENLYPENTYYLREDNSIYYFTKD